MEKIFFIQSRVSLDVHKTPLHFKTPSGHFTILRIDDKIDDITWNTIAGTLYPWYGLQIFNIQDTIFKKKSFMQSRLSPDVHQTPSHAISNLKISSSKISTWISGYPCCMRCNSWAKQEIFWCFFLHITTYVHVCIFFLILNNMTTIFQAKKCLPEMLAFWLLFCLYSIQQKLYYYTYVSAQRGGFKIQI